ncbi:autotransporter outer membrane beta-barrel domain-containing protein [Candidatus Pelagibacter sp.]|nr:autotransporter outer membrane beta-barrel domain-containing protein [Candidatus Pelagibacter sp.]
MLKILKEPKSTKLLNNFFFRKNKELIIMELLKLFFLIASIIVFFETTAKAQATLTSDITVRPGASGLTNSEGDTIVRDAFQTPTGLAFSNDGRKVFSSNKNVSDTHECISMMTLSTPYDLRTASLVVDSADPLETKALLTGSNDIKCTDIKFSKDGLKLFLGNTTGKIHGFELAEPFELKGLTYSSNVTSDLGGEATFSFSNDGKKLIYLDGTKGGQHIDEYSLSTAYDLTSITLVNTTDLRTTANVSSSPEKDHGMALEFSHDGMTMFVLINDDTNDINTSLDSVFQFSLTTSFSTSTATLAGSLTLPEELSLKTYGIAFSGMGDKLYIVSIKGPSVGGSTTDVVTQVSLSCNYGLVACVSDPRSSLGTQVQLAKNNISMNTSIIFKRFEWIKRNRNSNNLNNFTASIKSDNPLLNYWVKKFPDKLLSVNEKVKDGQSITIGQKDINNNKLNNFTTAIKSDNPLLNSWMDKLPETITAYQVALKKKLSKNKKSDWLYWSFGDLTIGSYNGKSGGPGINLEKPKDIRTSGLTFGADKKNSKNNYTGYAIRYADGKSKFAASGPSTTMASLTLNYYLITPLKDSGYTNTVVGLSSLKYDLKTGGVVTGQRNGKQLFTSIDFRSDSEYGKFNLTPSLKIKHALTSLSDFTEFMTNTSSAATNVIYEKETFHTGDLAMGFLFNSDPVKHSTGTMSHNGGLEFVYDYSPDITFDYSYAGSSNAQQYTVEKYSQKNIRANYGYENVYNNNFTLSLNYERFQHLDSDKFSHTDSFLIKVGHISEEDTQFAFDFDPLSNNSAKLSYVKDINNFNLKLNSNMNLFTKIPDYGANLEVSSKF